jgi:hypothetical protein
MNISQYLRHQKKILRNEKINKFFLKAVDVVWWSSVWSSLAWGGVIASANMYNSLLYYGINKDFDKIELAAIFIFSMAKGGLHLVTGPISMSWFAMTYYCPEKFGITVTDGDYLALSDKKYVQNYYKNKTINNTLTPQDIVMYSYFVPVPLHSHYFDTTFKRVVRYLFN